MLLPCARALSRPAVYAILGATQGVKIWKHPQGGINGVHQFKIGFGSSCNNYQGTFTPGTKKGYFAYTFPAATSKSWCFHMLNGGHHLYTALRFIQLKCVRASTTASPTHAPPPPPPPGAPAPHGQAGCTACISKERSPEAGPWAVTATEIRLSKPLLAGLSLVTLCGRAASVGSRGAVVAH